MKIGAYLRVSTEEQTRCYGLDVQRERLQAYCTFKGWENVTWYEDPGESGGDLDRPGLQRLLADVDAGKLEVVLTYKADRLSRKLKDLLVVIEDRLTPAGATFVSATEDFNTATASGQACLSMLGTFAELERNTIRDRTLEGRKQKAAQGGVAVGRAPLGYEAQGGALQENRDESATVRSIFQWRAEGDTFQQIADRLNAEGVPTKAGGQWYKSTVHYIIRNPKYRGVLRHAFPGQTYETPAPGLALVEE